MQRKLYSDDKVGTVQDLEVTTAALQVECKRQRLLKQQILQQMHALALEYTLHDVRLCLSLIHKLHQQLCLDLDCDVQIVKHSQTCGEAHHFCLMPRRYMPSAECCKNRGHHRLPHARRDKPLPHMDAAQLTSR